MARSIEERIADQQKKISQEKARLQKLKSKENEAKRKARTKRLIELGAVMENIIGEENNTPEMRSVMNAYFTTPRQTRSGETTTNVETFIRGLKNLLADKEKEQRET